MPMAIPILGAAFLAAGSVMTAVGVTAAIAGISLATIATVAGAALMAVSMLTMQVPKPSSAGTQLDTLTSSKAAVPVLYGRTATGGTVVYDELAGKENRYRYLAIALSAAGPIAGVDAAYANDVGLNFLGDPTSAISMVTSTSPASKKLYRNKFAQRWLVGEAPSPTTISQGFGSYGPSPKAPGKASGHALALVYADYDSDQFPQGFPKLLWTVRGVKVYDPRKDSTYPGGSGSQRLATPSTWAFSENPFLCALHWTLGKYENGRKVVGIGALPSEVDFPAFVRGANVADSNGWKCGGVVSTSDDKFAVLSTILAAGGGVPIARGAQISCFVNTPLTTTASIVAADVIRDVEIQNSSSLRQRYNTVAPTYREPSQFWKMVAGQQVTSTVYVEEDAGFKASKEVEFTMVQQAKQAHQLATYNLVNSREMLTFTVGLKLRALSYRVGDAVVVNVPEVASGATKCLVINREYNPSDQVVTLTLKSENDAKHAFALGQSQVAPPTIALTGYDKTDLAAPESTAWIVTGSTLTSATGTKPIIRVGGARDNPYAAAIIVEYRPVGAADWQQGGTYSRDTTAIEIITVTSNTAYQVAISYRSSSGAVSDRTIYGPVTAGGEAFQWQAVTGPQKPQDGATVGAPPGTQVGGIPAEDIAAGHIEFGNFYDTVPATVTLTASNVTSSVKADGAVKMTVKWTAISGVMTYDVGIKDASETNWNTVQVGETATFIADVVANSPYNVRVRALSGSGKPGNWSATVNHTAVKDTVAPAAPTAFTATDNFGGYILEWTNPTASDLVRVDVYASATNSSAAATLFASEAVAPSTKTKFLPTEATAGVTRYFFLKAVDRSGNASVFSAGASAKTLKIEEVAPEYPGDNIIGNISKATVDAGTIKTGTIHVDRIETVRGSAVTGLLSESVLIRGSQINSPISATLLAAGSILSPDLIIGSGGPSIGTLNTNFAEAKAAADSAVTTATQKASEAAQSATQSSTSAAVASTSAAAATLTAATGPVLPNGFSEDGKYWGPTGSGLPSRASLSTTPSTGITFVTVAGVGRVAQIDSSAVRGIAPLGWMGWKAGQRYRIEAVYRAISGSTTARVYRASFNDGGTDTGSPNSARVTTTDWQTHAFEMTADAGAGTVYIRPWIRFDASAGCVVQVSSLTITDVTAQLAAAGSATAAASSASAANTSAGAAGSSASAADTAKTAAETARGQAQTFASNASGSADSAAGSASTATTQAGVSASSATNAANAQRAAELATQRGGVTTFDDKGRYFFTSGNPFATTNSIPDTSFRNVSGVGNVYFVTNAGTSAVSSYPKTRKLLPNIVGRTYRSTVVFRAIDANVTGRSFALLWQENGTQANFTPGSNMVVTPAMGWIAATHDFVGSNASYPYVSMQAELSVAPGATVEVRSLDIVDVTSEVAALGSATAAASSAANANTSATNAGQFATAASNSKTSAETAAGNASTSATQSSSSATSALASATAMGMQSNASFDAGFTNWTNSYTGNTQAGGASGQIQASYQGASNVLLTPANSRADIAGEIKPILNARTYRITIRLYASVAGMPLRFGMHVRSDAAVGNTGGNVELDAPALAQGWNVVTADFGAGTTRTWAADRVWGKLFLIMNGPSPVAGQLAIDYAMLEDISESTSAATSATAATTAKTLAESARGQAQTFAANAATSADNAAGSASTATTQAGISAASAAAATQIAANGAVLPNDFSQNGSYWASNYQGLPTRANFGLGNANLYFPTVAGIGTVAQLNNVAGDLDIANLGWLMHNSSKRYRLNVRARTTSGTAQMVSFMIGLNDTGTGAGSYPSRTDTVTTTWQTFTLENTSAYPGVEARALVRRTGSTSNGIIQIASIEFIDITSEAGAKVSADAAATSASTATTKAGEAGTSAAAASASAVTANTKAGEASSSASAASASATQASASQAAAETMAKLSASVAAAGLNSNGLFGDWTATYPAGWAGWSGSVPAKITGRGSPFAAQFVTAAGVTSHGIQQTYSNAPTSSLSSVSAGWYVVEVDVELVEGSFLGSGVLWRGVNDANATAQDLHVNFAVELGAGQVGKTYTIRKRIQFTNASVVRGQIFLMAQWGTFGAATAKTINVYRCSVRPASDAEASVTTLQGAVATIEGKTSAYWQTVANAGPNSAIISAKADSVTGSSVGIAANSINLYTINGNTVLPGLLIEDGVVTLAGEVRAGSIKTNHIAAGQVVTNHMSANSINGDRVTTGTLSADRITAGSITARELSLADLTNLVPNGDLITLQNFPSSGRVSAVADPTNAYAGKANVLVVTPAASAGWVALANSTFSVEAGEQVYFEIVARAADGAVGRTDVQIRWERPDGSQTSTATVGVSSAATTWTRATINATAPANTTQGRLQFYASNTAGNFFIGQIRIYRRNAGNLIVDGTITTNHMSANTINGDRIAANTLNANKIVSGTITTNLMSVGSINGDRITANTLDASTIKAGSVMAGTVMVSGTPMSTISSNAASGAQAATDTAQYRTKGVPTNNPVPAGAYITANSNGSRNVQLNWNTYTQGARQADFLMLFWRRGSTVPTVNDPSVSMNVNTASNSNYMFEGISPADVVSYGIAAARRTEAGMEIGPIQTHASWTNVSAATPNYTGNLNGSTAATVVSNAALGAQDPGARINAASTTIDPGKILISGATTLANWRNGSDTTKIEGGSIATNTITANQIAANSISADKVQAGAITANKLSVDSLSAITANIGLLRTASSGARAEFDNNGMRVYATNNVLITRIGLF